MVPDIPNKETTFNEAVLKMQRIHAVQLRINELRTNMLAWNPNHGKYNYEIVISDLISLCSEVSPLMKDIEIKEFKLLRQLVDDLLTYKPVYKNLNTSSFNNDDNKQTVDIENWNMLRKLMFKFEDFARKQVDVHGLSAPKKKDASSAAIDL